MASDVRPPYNVTLSNVCILYRNLCVVSRFWGMAKVNITVTERPHMGQ